MSGFLFHKSLFVFVNFCIGKISCYVSEKKWIIYRDYHHKYMNCPHIVTRKEMKTKRENSVFQVILPFLHYYKINQRKQLLKFYIVSLKKNWYNSIISMLKKPLKYREVFIFKINLYSVYCLVNNIPQTIDFFTLHLYKFNCKVQVVCPFQIVFKIN